MCTWRLSPYYDCCLWWSLHYEVCCIMRFFWLWGLSPYYDCCLWHLFYYEVCRLRHLSPYSITFVAYDVCCLWHLSPYYVWCWWCLSHYNVCGLIKFVANAWCLSHYEVCFLWHFVALRYFSPIIWHLSLIGFVAASYISEWTVCFAKLSAKMPPPHSTGL